MSKSASIPQMAARIAAAGKRAGFHVRRDVSYKSDSQYVYWFDHDLSFAHADEETEIGVVKFRVSDHSNDYGDDVPTIDIRRAEQIPTALAIGAHVARTASEWVSF